MKTYSELPYSKKILWRKRGAWILLLAMVIYMIVIGEMGLGDSRVVSQFAKSFGSFLFFSGMIWVGAKIINCNKLLKNPPKLREQMISEDDERNRYIYHKSGGIVWDIIFAVMLFVTVTASVTNNEAFYTAFVMLAVSAAVKLAVYLMFKRKT